MRHCPHYSRTRVLFTAYDDQIARGIDVFEGCERNDVMVVEKYVFGAALQIAATSSVHSVNGVYTLLKQLGDQGGPASFDVSPPSSSLV
ncbi:MAG TPA: hypothetical protein VN833_09415 [Candidatus Acidoferrales bacterium]|nr:hypothetical protein [Candidatus Acidoferrales bacterium]